MNIIDIPDEKTSCVEYETIDHDSHVLVHKSRRFFCFAACQFTAHGFVIEVTKEEFSREEDIGGDSD